MRSGIISLYTPNLAAYFLRKDDFVSEVRFWSAVLFPLDWRYVLCVNTVTASIYVGRSKLNGEDAISIYL